MTLSEIEALTGATVTIRQHEAACGPIFSVLCCEWTRNGERLRDAWAFLPSPENLERAAKSAARWIQHWDAYHGSIRELQAPRNIRPRFKLGA